MNMHIWTRRKKEEQSMSKKQTTRKEMSMKKLLKTLFELQLEWKIQQ